MTNNNFTQEQQEKIVEIGSDLKSIRLAKSISLDSIAAQTLISKSLLEGIEEGNFEELPELFYVRALMLKFAREIGAEKLETKISELIDANPETDSVRSRAERKYWLNFQLRSLHLYLIYILLVILSVKGITHLVERPVIVREVPLEEPLTDTKVTKSQTPTETALSSSSSPAPQFVSQSSNSESVTVGINLQERCWLKVMVDGKVAFEGILPKGTKKSWSGNQKVTIRAGNAGGVVISFNNEQQKVLGAPGQVEEITYTVN